MRKSCVVLCNMILALSFLVSCDCAMAPRMKTYNVVVLKGDGIGPEIIDAALQVLDAVEKKLGRFQLNLQF